MKDIEERLREYASFITPAHVGQLLAEAADVIHTLRREASTSVRHGVWERWSNDKFMGYGADGKIKYRKVSTYECDRCGYGTAVKSRFCPNCGANMMDGEN